MYNALFSLKNLKGKNKSELELTFKTTSNIVPQAICTGNILHFDSKNTKESESFFFPFIFLSKT